MHLSHQEFIRRNPSDPLFIFHKCSSSTRISVSLDHLPEVERAFQGPVHHTVHADISNQPEI